jgi:tripartite-type tricarboxylate transporter receptor subunit TctC
MNSACLRATGTVLIALAFLLESQVAGAQDIYPARPVRIVVPISAGAGVDLVARLIALGLTERLGKQFIVENRVGASGIIGTDFVAKSKPDGYTLLMGAASFAISPALYAKLPYAPERDFAAITQAVSTPSLLALHPSVPVRSVKELIALARARPNQILYASAGQGTAPHLAMELFASMAQIHLVHVPYKGAAGIVDVMAGNVSMMMSNVLQSLPPVRAGRLRALGVTTAQRVSIAPDIPTIAESGLPGYEAVQWYGLLAPAGTPQDIIAKVQRESAAVLQLPASKKTLGADGVLIVASSPEDFSRYIKSEMAKWTKVVKAAGIKPEG